MDLQRVVAIFRKDFVAAFRDARILIALVVPIGLGLIYNFAFEDNPPAPKATVAYAASDESRLPDLMRGLAGESLRLTFTPVAGAEEARRKVEEDKADLGLTLPAGFDLAVAQGEAPEMSLVLPESPSVGGSIAAALLDPALRELAGQGEPATVGVDVVPPGEHQSIIDRAGQRRYYVLSTTIVTIAMIGMFVVPMVLTDEAEKKTLDALLLIASDREVIAAKALFGLAAIAIAIPLLLVLTRLGPSEPVAFLLGLVLASVALVGLGLLLGGLLSASQLNTWGGVLILPVVFPALVVGVAAPGWLTAIYNIVPTTHAMKLALNGVSGKTLFPHVWVSAVVLIGWCVALYALVLWRLSRREA